jgi:hypothetical protein
VEPDSKYDFIVKRQKHNHEIYNIKTNNFRSVRVLDGQNKHLNRDIEVEKVPDNYDLLLFKINQDEKKQADQKREQIRLKN